MKNVNDFVQEYRGNDNKGSEYLSKVYMLLGELQNSKSSQYSWFRKIFRSYLMAKIFY